MHRVDAVGNSSRVCRELTEGIGSLPGWCKGVHQKKTETDGRLSGVAEKLVGTPHLLLGIISGSPTAVRRFFPFSPATAAFFPRQTAVASSFPRWSSAAVYPTHRLTLSGDDSPEPTAVIEYLAGVASSPCW
ncbi:hypothetical protein GW17_00046334 [Ensete ventricosum]|nr:hypothetical protein GW17_00046334 [Ensete ventricosum]